MNILRWLTTPKNSPEIDPKNFMYVQVDAVGVGFVAAAATFLPIYLTRLGASSTQVGLLTSMPAVTGLLLAIPVGRFLQRRRHIVPWFSFSRLGVIACYALTGLAGLFLSTNSLIPTILLIWALATFPQIILAITFSVVMNAVAGPQGRFELMTRRWSILGATSSIGVIIMGQILDRVPEPFNYPVVFLGCALIATISFIFSRRIRLPENTPPADTPGQSLRQRISGYLDRIRSETPFVSFISKRFVFLTGATLATPLFPLYFVREVHASDSWIAAINTAQTVILIIGYFFWSQQSRRRGSRSVLIWATCGISFYPVLVAMTHEPAMIMVFAGFAGIFQAGVDLVFFDELMKRVPPQYSATFVSFAQSIQYISTIIAPMAGTTLAGAIGLAPALIISGALRFMGFLLFALGREAKLSAS